MRRGAGLLLYVFVLAGCGGATAQRQACEDGDPDACYALRMSGRMPAPAREPDAVAPPSDTESTRTIGAVVTKLPGEMKLQGGGVTKDDVQRVINAGVGRVQRCYERTLLQRAK